MYSIFNIHLNSMSAQHPLRILLVDDDRIFRFTTKKLLATCGLPVEVIEQPNGQEALNYLKEHNQEESGLPDLIFLDLNMPVMNGQEFLAEISKVNVTFKKPLPVCIVSSSLDHQDVAIVAQFENIVCDYLVKPVTRNKYREVLDTLADRA